MQSIEIGREFQIIIFEKCREYLEKQGYDCIVEEGFGFLDLLVDVPGPSYSQARFYIKPVEDVAGSPLEIMAEWGPSEDDVSLSSVWYAAPTDSAEDLCRDLFIDFVKTCSFNDFSAIVEAEIINDDNLDEFFDLLSDEALSLDGIYAAGFRIQDEGGLEIAAAASFFFTEEELVVDNIEIIDNYDIPGFEEYIAEYIYETVTVE